MMLPPLLVVLAVGVILVLQYWAGKRRIRDVLAYARTQGWEMLIVDPFIACDDNEGTTTHYRVRFRDVTGVLVEAVLHPAVPTGFRLAREQRIPAEIGRAMFDLGVPLDCRKCGTIIPAGANKCYYCHAARNELRIR